MRASSDQFSLAWQYHFPKFCTPMFLPSACKQRGNWLNAPQNSVIPWGDWKLMHIPFPIAAAISTFFTPSWNSHTRCWSPSAFPHLFSENCSATRTARRNTMELCDVGNETISKVYRWSRINSLGMNTNNMKAALLSLKTNLLIVTF